MSDPSPVQVVVVSALPAGVVGRDQQAVNQWGHVSHQQDRRQGVVSTFAAG